MTVTTRTDRRAELLKRGGIDPVRIDSRPLSEIMQDEIPYARWARQRETMRRAGYDDYQDFLANWEPPNE